MMTQSALTYFSAAMLLAVPLIILVVGLLIQIVGRGEKNKLKSNTVLITVGILPALVLLIPYRALGVSAHTFSDLGRVMTVVSLTPLVAAVRPGTSITLRITLCLGSVILFVFWYFNRIVI